MIELKNEKLFIRNLVIELDDALPENIHYFKGKRFNKIFIHKDNKFKDKYKKQLEPTISMLGYYFGEFYEYE